MARTTTFSRNQGTLTRERAGRASKTSCSTAVSRTGSTTSPTLLKAGKGPRQILDVLQVAAAELMLECGAAENYSMPQHTRRILQHAALVLRRLRPSAPGQAAVRRGRDGQHRLAQPGCRSEERAAPRRHTAWRRKLDRRPHCWSASHAALLARNTDESLALVHAYVTQRLCHASALVQLLAQAAAEFGNDPHNQEICLCLLEDYVQSTAVDRERLLFGSVVNLTGYRKYGDPLESYQRFAAAFDLPSVESVNGDAPVEALALDD